MKRGMFRMPAIVEKRFRRLVFFPNLQELMRARVVFTKMSAQAALPVVNLNHNHLASLDTCASQAVSKLAAPR